MFIVFGSPRSGTTLLAATLDQHDAIVVPHETDFIVPMAFIFNRVRDEQVGKKLIQDLIPATQAFPGSIGQYLNKEDVVEVVARSRYLPGEILTNLYDLVAQRAGKQIAGDKSPNDLLFVRMLDASGTLDSTIKVIHIIRDVRDVIASLMRVSWAPTNIEAYFARFWSYSNLYLYERLRGSPHRYVLMKYEDMVTQPKETFDQLTSFLGVSFQESMLERTKRGARYAGWLSHERLGDDFSVSRIGIGKRELEPPLLQLIEKQAKEGLEHFGYLIRDDTTLQQTAQTLTQERDADRAQLAALTQERDAYQKQLVSIQRSRAWGVVTRTWVVTGALRKLKKMLCH
jgi:hypothetical protein